MACSVLDSTGNFFMKLEYLLIFFPILMKKCFNGQIMMLFSKSVLKILPYMHMKAL